MLKRAGSWCWSVLKNILLYSAHRSFELVRYCGRVLVDTSINALIMIPVCLGVYWLLAHFGLIVYVPIGFSSGRTAVPIWYIAYFFFKVGVVEETTFRYLIQDCLLGRWLRLPGWLCLVVASVGFGCAHFINPGTYTSLLPQVIGASCAGVWFGWIYRKRGLHNAIWAHALYDFTITFVSVIIQS